MPAPIIIEVTPQAKAVIRKLQRFPQEMGQAIKRGMDEAGLIAQKEIAATRFTGAGKKPFPVLEHRLRNISERLRTSLIYRAAKIEMAGSRVAVTGALGSFGVKYFPVHEFGYSGVQFVNSFFRKKPGGGTALVAAHGREMHIPARAPMRHGIMDQKINFQTKIQKQLEAEWAKKR